MKITTNKQKKTFTITTNGNKYQISAFSKTEFEDLENNTQGDWANYLKTQDYISLKK